MEKMKIVMVALIMAASMLVAGNLAESASVPKEKVAGIGGTDSQSCPGYSRVNIGGMLDAGAYYTLKLSDIAVDTGPAKAHPAIIDVLDPNDVLLERIQVMPGQTYVYGSSIGSKIAISVCQTAFGYTLNSNWAKIKAEPTSSQPTAACRGAQTLSIGESHDYGEISIALDDIGVATGGQNAHPAILSATQDANGLVQKLTIAPGESQTILIANNHYYKITVCQTAPGAMLNAKWAKIKVTQVYNGNEVEYCYPSNWNGTFNGGYVDVGGQLSYQGTTARLADISTGTGAANSHPAIVEILDSNGAVLDSASVEIGADYTYFAENGAAHRVYVCDTAPGYTLNSKWAFLVVQ